MRFDQPRKRVSHLSILQFFLIASLSGCGGAATTAPTKNTSVGEREDTLAVVRETLRKGADLEACRGVMQQLNDHVNLHPDDRPPTLTESERELLTNLFGLENDELAEVNSGTFTLLDAPYLHACLLARDLAAVLQVDELPPLERAHAAFTWVVREVRLREHRRILLPVEVALRRGWGSQMERANIFLTLLDQLGLEGCLLAAPAAEKDQGAILWLVGAVVNEDIYLFDPRMGLPLPGPEGKGIATLAQLRAKPELLLTLNVDDKLRYDITPERAKAAEVYVTCPLSSLAPRLRWLQARLASPNQISLARDPVAVLKRIEALDKKAPPASGVKVWNPVGDIETPVRALRAFLPVEEGGIDKHSRREAWRFEVVPWDLMPRRLLALPGEPGNRMKGLFSALFVGLIADPKMPRELMLRGRYDEATSKLVQMRTELRRLQGMAANRGDLEEQLRPWCERAIAAYGTLLRAEQDASSPTGGGQAAVVAARSEVAALWKDSQRVQVLLQALAAEPLSGEITYFLALCKHEQAEQAQARRIRLKQSASDPDRTTAEEAWRAAGEWWDTCLEEAPAGPHAAAARCWRARTLEALGQPAPAAKLLQDLSGEMTDLEKVARLFRARQLAPR